MRRLRESVVSQESRLSPNGVWTRLARSVCCAHARGAFDLSMAQVTGPGEIGLLASFVSQGVRGVPTSRYSPALRVLLYACRAAVRRGPAEPYGGVLGDRFDLRLGVSGQCCLVELRLPRFASNRKGHMHTHTHTHSHRRTRVHVGEGVGEYATRAMSRHWHLNVYILVMYMEHGNASICLHPS